MTPPYNKDTTVGELVTDYAKIIKGKTILTTGVSPSSLGAVFVEAVVTAKPGLLILAGRSLTKLQQTADTIASTHPDVKARLLVLDLASLNSVRRAAEEVNSWDDVPKIDVLVNSAGIMATKYKLTEDGFESQFATNHLGHFLFTNRIMEKILASESPRVVSVSSNGHRAGCIRLGDPNFSASFPPRSNGETYDKWTAYGQSKTANMLFAISLAEKLGKRGLQAYSLHPGAIFSTSLGNHLDFTSAENDDLQGLIQADRAIGDPWGWVDWSKVPVTAEQGAATYAFAAFDPELKNHNGAYLLESRLADPFTDTVRPWATSPIEAEKLWKLSEKLIGQEFSY